MVQKALGGTASEGVSLLDAGCGTGRQAAAFVEAGFVVDIADASEPLLAEARRRCPAARANLVDLTRFDLGRQFDVVTCRGVLNDMTTPEDRTSAVHCLADHVAPGGHLILDLREAAATAARGSRHSTTRVETPDGLLTFDNETTWAEPLLLSEETFTLSNANGGLETASFSFAMRPWTEQELRTALTAAGLDVVEIEPAAYRPSGDRLFAHARRP
jgi:SAM-dependent methyltransferase